MILVSILGDFHSSVLPISYEFRKEISRHIVLYDDANWNTKESWRILRGQKSFLESMPEGSPSTYELTSMQLDEDSYESIVERFEEIWKMKEKNNEEVYLNSTDGLSSIAVVFASKLLEKGGSVLSYDKFANTYNLHTFNQMHKHQMRDKMDIETHMLLKGYSIESLPSKQALEERRETVFSLLENMSGYMAFLQKVIASNRCVKNVQGYEKIKKKLESMGKVNDFKYIHKEIFNEYIFHLLKVEFDFDDVLSTVKVKAEENVEVELDILIIKDNHLHVLECEFSMHSNGPKQIYRMETVLDYLDDDSKAMILSIGREGKQFNSADKARAEYGNIKIHKEETFNARDFLHDVGQWFG